MRGGEKFHRGDLTVDSPLPTDTLSAIPLPSTAISMFGADGVVTSAAVASVLACSSVVHADGFVGIWGSNSWAK